MFHFIQFTYLNISDIPVNIDNNSNGYSSFRSRNSDRKKSKEKPFQLPRKQITVKYRKIDIHRIQYQFNRYQNSQ